MKVESQRPEEGENAVSALNTAIEALNLAKDGSGVAPAKAVFGSVSVILVMIRVSFLLFFLLTDCRLKCNQDAMIKQVHYVELGLDCADVCIALHRRLDGKRLGGLNGSVCEAINQLTT